MEETATAEKPKLYGPLTTVIITVGVFIAAQILGAVVFILGYSLYQSMHLYGSNFSAHYSEVMKALADNITNAGGGAFLTFLQIVCIEAVTLWLIHLFLKRRKLSFRTLGLNTPKAKYIAYALSGFAVYFVLYIAGLILIKQLVPSLDLEQKQELGFETATNGAASLWPVFISLVILPPITEEIVARGFLYGGLRTKLPMATATIITSLLFASAHLGEAKDGLLWVAAIDTFVLSLVLCYLREKTKSLWPSIGVHAIKNGLAFVILFNIVQYLR
jgi:membrane protease YdiL (CAAX protease family)